MSTMQTSSEQTLAEAQKRQTLKEKLLRSLENNESIPSGGVSTEDTLHELRQRELNDLLHNQHRVDPKIL